MTIGFKISIATALTVGAILLWYYGAYLPITKSHAYIQTYLAFPNVKSLEEFDALFNPVLDYYSPVGEDETVSAYLGIIGDALGRNPSPPKEVADALLREAASRMQPILARGSGFVFSQNIFKLGMIYKVAAQHYGDLNYYKRSLELFRLGLTYSPARGVFLYNLFDLCHMGQDLACEKRIGATIIEYWPQEQAVRQELERIDNLPQR